MCTMIVQHKDFKCYVTKKFDTYEIWFSYDLMFEFFVQDKRSSRYVWTIPIKDNFNIEKILYLT